ncbi:MAG: rRNA maturation RNase YbeY [Terricaulis sp.]
MAEQSFEVDIVVGCPLWRGHEELLSAAAAATAAEEGASGVVSLLLGDDAAVAGMNAQFRGKQGPTNVLSFPPVDASEASHGFLGDIALAAETIAAEAQFQGKRFEHHAAHLVVHGFLHLLGYDHIEPADAESMEARERAILVSLGIDDPYA